MEEKHYPYTMMYGKKCVLHDNGTMNKEERYLTYRNGRVVRRSRAAKRFEVYEIVNINGNDDYSEYSRKDVHPYYSRLGWDTLEEAKVFFMLMEL